MYELYNTGFGCNRTTSAPGDVGLMEKHLHITMGAVLLFRSGTSGTVKTVLPKTVCFNTMVICSTTELPYENEILYFSSFLYSRIPGNTFLFPV